MIPVINVESTIEFEDIVKDVVYRDSGFRLDIYVELKNHKYLEYSDHWTSGPDYIGTVIEFTPYLFNDKNEPITDFEEIKNHPEYFKIDISFDDKEYGDYFVTPLKYEYRISFIKAENFDIRKEECEVKIWE